MSVPRSPARAWKGRDLRLQQGLSHPPLPFLSRLPLAGMRGTPAKRALSSIAHKTEPGGR
eukprot:2534215-Rhodomonas_salina.2